MESEERAMRIGIQYYHYSASDVRRTHVTVLENDGSRSVYLRILGTLHIIGFVKGSQCIQLGLSLERGRAVLFITSQNLYRSIQSGNDTSSFYWGKPSRLAATVKLQVTNSIKLKPLPVQDLHHMTCFDARFWKFYATSVWLGNSSLYASLFWRWFTMNEQFIDR